MNPNLINKFLAINNMDILIVCAVILFIIIFICIYILISVISIKNLNKKIDILYKPIKDFEYERINDVKNGLNFIKEQNKEYNPDFDNITNDCLNILDNDIKIQRGYVRQSLDYISIFIRRYIQEELKISNNEILDKIKENEYKQTTIYNLYNKKALLYNSFLNSPLVKMFTKKYVKASIL